MKLPLIFLAAYCFLAVQQLRAQEPSEELEQLTEWMTGEFATQEPVNFDSLDTRLEWRLVRFKPEHPNGAWIYSELSAEGDRAQPIRQWVYFVSSFGPGELSADVYHLPDAEKYAGAWSDPSLLSDLTPFNMKYQEGCTVFLTYDGFQYDGSTNEKTCRTAAAGADYVMTKLNITPAGIKYVENGYSESGDRVWGVGSDPYLFKPSK